MTNSESMHNKIGQEFEGRQRSHFLEILENKWSEGKFVSVGLDSDYAKIPDSIKTQADGNIRDAIFLFNKEIIDATSDLANSYKPNAAFYEKYGSDGIQALEATAHYIKENHPTMPVVLDAKRADIGNTNEGYVEFAFDRLEADAITVHPYLGKEAMKPFLERRNKGVIVLAKTSNSGSGEFQDLASSGIPLYQQVAKNVAEEWNYNGNCALVVGATYPEELAKVRELAPRLPILIPGIGAQGGDLERTLQFGRDTKNQGMIINSSRGIIFASKGFDFAQAARRETQKLHNQISRGLSRL